MSREAERAARIATTAELKTAEENLDEKMNTSRSILFEEREAIPSEAQPDFQPTTPLNKSGTEEVEDKRPKVEKAAACLMGELQQYIEKRKGQFLRDEDDSLHVILDGKRILINDDKNNGGMVNLMLRACGVGTLLVGARLAIQRLQVHADLKAGKMSFRKFSALSADGKRLYLPLAGGQLLRITSEEITPADNGKNVDSFWVEHPFDGPFDYSSKLNLQEALGHFERLIVETQSCAIPEMKWLVAMGEGLFPYLRDAFPARFILVHQGSTQQGKTSGVQRFTLLHGLGQVMGDCSVASLGNLGDIGLLAMDNKEQKNFKQELIDFCLFLATGANRVRSFTDGTLRFNRHRPVGVITTIEGVSRQEMEARCVTVEYAVKGTTLMSRGPIEYEIQQRRNEIFSGLVVVLQRYFQVRGQRPSPNPIPNCEEHFTALCDLLRAYGDVAEKPKSWAEGIIKKWAEVIGARGEDEEEELEHPILRVILEPVGTWDVNARFLFEGAEGTLYKTTSGELLTMLQKLRLYDLKLPNPNGLSARLRSAKFKAFRFLTTDSVEELKRTANKKPIGFFFTEGPAKIL